MANRDSVKPWFETGDFPTQAQFYQLFDWLFFKDETIEQANVSGLAASLLAKADAGTVAAINSRVVPNVIVAPEVSSFPIVDGHLVDKIVIIPTAADTIRAGTVPGTDDVFPEQLLIAGMANVISIQPGVYGVEGTTIHFTGFTESAQIIIFKR